MIRYFTSITLAVCFFFSCAAQENTKFENRIYRTWIYTNNNENIKKGVLFEIKDSSILISNSLHREDYLSGNFKLSDIGFEHIEYVSLRGKNNLLIGSILGTAAGVTGAVGIVHSIARKDEYFGAMLFFGTPVIALGTGIGALVGSLRIHIPVKGRFESFKRNEHRLKSYSYLQEYYGGLNFYEQQYDHKCFIGLLLGPSFPGGYLNDNPDVRTGSAKTGGTGGFILGYSIIERFGISASFLNSSYNIKNSITDEWWSLISILAGPMFSIPLKDGFFVDMKLMTGIINSSLNTGDISEKTVAGFGIYPCTAIRYNISRHWCAFTETGYLFSRQKFEDGKRMTNVVNLSFGAGYRFR